MGRSKFPGPTGTTLRRPLLVPIAQRFNTSDVSKRSAPKIKIELSDLTSNWPGATTRNLFLGGIRQLWPQFLQEGHSPSNEDSPYLTAEKTTCMITSFASSAMPHPLLHHCGASLNLQHEQCQLTTELEKRFTPRIIQLVLSSDGQHLPRQLDQPSYTSLLLHSFSLTHLRTMKRSCFTSRGSSPNISRRWLNRSPFGRFNRSPPARSRNLKYSTVSVR